MKIESNKINESTKEGSIRLTPEDEDDIWELSESFRGVHGIDITSYRRET